MSVYELKPRFQSLLRPLTRALFDLGVTANVVTVMTCVISVALGVILAISSQQETIFLLVPIWFFIRMAFNAIDGMLAREFGQASPLGVYLNELTDVVSDAALYFPFALLPYSDPLLVGIVIVLSIVSEMTGVLGVLVGAERRYDGPMGKSDRAFVFAIVGLLFGIGVSIGEVLNGIWVVVAVLLVLTIVNRVRSGLARRQRL